MRARALPRVLAFCLPAVCLPAVSGGLPSQTAAFTIQNLAPHPRTGIVRASVPFARGEVFDPDQFSVEGRPTAWRVLQRWPDGSARVAQAQFQDSVGPLDTVARRVVPGARPMGDFVAHPWVLPWLDAFLIVTEVHDVDGLPYYAQPVWSEVLEHTGAVVTLRSRSYHRALPGGPAGIGRDFLSQTLYLTFFRESPIAYLDVVIGNDYLGADRPIGNDPNLHPLADVALRSARLHLVGPHGAVRFEEENRVDSYHALLPGVSSYHLLEDAYLADGQTKRWRIVLLFENPWAPPAQRLEALSTLAAEWMFPLIPLASLSDWQRTSAFGVHGGPVRPPQNPESKVASEWASWRNPSRFGPFGNWGDLKETYVGGTPRNGPHSVPGSRAVQTGRVEPAIQLEGMAWQQALRPYHLWGLRVEPHSDIFFDNGLPYTITGGRRVSQETLGRLALHQSDPWSHWRNGVPLSAAHGWNAFDVEHWSTDLLFDYFTLTGDHWAREELRMLGECLMGTLRQTKYFTSTVVLAARAEGWCMQGFVQCYLATGDPRLKDAARARLHNLIEPNRHKGHPSRALSFQGSHDATGFPWQHSFYMAWQHAAVVYGYTAAAKFFEDPLFLAVAHDVVATVVHSWVVDHQHKIHGWVPHGLRYFTPVEHNGLPIPPDYWDNAPDIGVRFGDSPLGGTHVFLISALDLIRETTADPSTLAVATAAREILHVGHRRAGAGWRWNKWSNLREPPD